MCSGNVVRAHVALFIVASVLLTTHAEPTSSVYQFDWHHNLTVTSFDGTLLKADAAVPRPKYAGEIFPVLVFPNSWGMPEMEYIAKTLEWAAMGYIMLEYETRGWFNSGGEIGTAGPSDRKDSLAVVDFVLNQTAWSPDSDNLAFCGVSYGAGLSLFAAADSPKVKTAISLSGWGNLLDALYSNESPSLVWGEILVVAAKLLGKAPPELTDLFSDLLHHENMTWVTSWAKERSPDQLMDTINKRQVPIFISNNYEDHLFKPQDALVLHQQLQGPKFMLLNQGIHATAEIGGLVGIPNNFVWKKVKLWVDYWLKNESNGIMDEPGLQFEVRNAIVPGTRTTFDTWPSSHVASNQMYLYPRGNKLVHGHGSLDKVQPSTNASDSIRFSRLDGLGAGTPIVAPLFQAYVDVPIVADLPIVSRDHAVYYQGSALTVSTRVCGTPNVTLTTRSNKPAFQIIAYLYSVNLAGVGTLISHAPYTKWEQSLTDVDENGNIQVSFALRSLCADVRKGHRLALGFDLFDVLYQPSQTSSALEVDILTGPHKVGSFLQIPIVDTPDRGNVAT